MGRSGEFDIDFMNCPTIIFAGVCRDDDMTSILHITKGDAAGNLLAKSGIHGGVCLA
jgi:hypothetical protein